MHSSEKKITPLAKLKHYKNAELTLNTNSIFATSGVQFLAGKNEKINHVHANPFFIDELFIHITSKFYAYKHKEVFSTFIIIICQTFLCFFL